LLRQGTEEGPPEGPRRLIDEFAAPSDSVMGLRHSGYNSGMSERSERTNNTAARAVMLELSVSEALA
jgi:hypothetical protein